MLRIELKDDEVKAALARMAAAMTDMRPAMQDIGEVLVEGTKQRFADGVDPDGNAWAPKSPTTIEAYKARGDSVSFRPLIGPTRTLSTTIHYIAGSDQVEIGSNRIQAAVMQGGAKKGQFGSYQGKGFGGTTPTISIPWGDIPARPFIGLSQTDAANVIDIVEEWLEGVAAGTVK